MSRTTRTIAAAGVAAIASLGVVTAPAHASDITEFDSVEATWEFAGALPGAPGNVHTGQILVNAGDRSFVWVSVNDWQCPDGIISPADDSCTLVRTGAAMADGSEADVAFTTDRKLTHASVRTTVPGGWSAVDGDWSDTDFTVDLDLTATGPLSREVRREQAATGGYYVVTEDVRSAAATGTVASIPMDGVTMQLSHTAIRVPASIDH